MFPIVCGNFLRRCSHLALYMYYVCCMFVLYMFATADIQSTGGWPLLKEFDDTELTRLASQLPATLLKSRADSSVKKYLGAYRC